MKSKAHTTTGYMRRQEAADYLRVTTRTLANWQTEGIVPFIKVKRRVVLFRRQDLDAALQRFRVAAVGESRKKGAAA